MGNVLSATILTRHSANSQAHDTEAYIIPQNDQNQMEGTEDRIRDARYKKNRQQALEEYLKSVDAMDAHRLRNTCGQRTE